MLTEEQERNLLTLCLLIWIVVSGLVIRSQWKQRLPSVGLPWIYLLNLIILHWFGALVYVFPWYKVKNVFLISQASSLSTTSAGFQQSTYGVLGFGLGCTILAPWLLKIFNPHWLWDSPRQPNFKLVKTYVIVGLLFTSVLSPILSKIPSGTSLIVSGSLFSLTGICLGCWESWYTGNKQALPTWILFTCLLPFYGLLTTGFMSIGTGAVVVVLLFVFNFYRPKWKLIVIGLLTLYLGLSIFVTYLRDRAIIRSKGSSESRIEQMQKTVNSFEFFDPFKQKHLELIDTRLNQNNIVGRAVVRISSGMKDYARGETIKDALIAAVPRILWKNKTVVSGSGDLVADYTGSKRIKGTSIGIGNVAELYVNFGSWGVFLGFLVFGCVFRVIDIIAGQRLISGNLVGFTSWFVPGISMINPTGSLVDFVQAIASSVVMVYIINVILLRRESRVKTVLTPNSLNGVSNREWQKQ